MLVGRDEIINCFVSSSELKCKPSSQQNDIAVLSRMKENEAVRKKALTSSFLAFITWKINSTIGIFSRIATVLTTFLYYTIHHCNIH